MNRRKFLSALGLGATALTLPVPVLAFPTPLSLVKKTVERVRDELVELNLQYGVPREIYAGSRNVIIRWAKVKQDGGLISTCWKILPEFGEADRGNLDPWWFNWTFAGNLSECYDQCRAISLGSTNDPNGINRMVDQLQAGDHHLVQSHGVPDSIRVFDYCSPCVTAKWDIGLNSYLYFDPRPDSSPGKMLFDSLAIAEFLAARYGDKCKLLIACIYQSNQYLYK